MRVLLVEDEPLISEFIAKGLREAGHNVDHAATGTDGLIDPHHGQRDLQARVLRHVGEAFREDPVRILRLARFAARFAGFTVAPEIGRAHV